VVVKIGTQINRVLTAFKKVEKKTIDAVRTGLYLEALAIIRKSMRQVPVETGRLRSTAFVTLPDRSKNPRLRMGYGTEYGIYVHERTDAEHLPPTKDHYLSDPIKDALPGLKERVAKRAKAALKSGRLLGDTASFPTEPMDGGAGRIRDKRKSAQGKRRKKSGFSVGTGVKVR
jgi:hypothetical protein